MLYKFYIWFIASFIRKKRLRHRFRSFKYMQYSINKVNKVKWGVSYSVFDGEDLLEESIKSIRKQVDYVNVVYQTISWYGKPADNDLVKKLERLKNIGLIDDLIYFEPDLKLKAWKNETIKRNIGLKWAKKRGVTYFMPMDVDEFYFSDELEYAKLKIINKGITHAFCPQEIYGPLPTLKCTHTKRAFINIFSRIYYFSKLLGNEYAPCLVDATRKISHYPWAKYYVLDTISMQHMTVLRKNISDKFANSSNLRLDANAYNKNKYVTVDDYFNLMPIVEKWRS